MRGATLAKKSPKQARGDKGETDSGYFRRIFTENLKLLGGRSNEEILNRWLTDHPSEKVVPDRIKSILSNVKSVMRKKLRKRRGRRPKEEQAAGATAVVVVARPRKAAARGLEVLEEMIDECMSLAKNLDSEGLAQVLAALRRARNQVVWKLGE
jgi:hypothetical protein